jgi:hypothetical protein
MESILHWLESSWLAQLVNNSTWMFPALEALHFLGLILLIGSLLVVDARLLGVGARVPVNAVMAFLPWSLVGFAINLVTGIMFFVSDPNTYYPNTAFRLKMLAVVLAGLNAIWFKRAVHPQLLASPDSSALPENSRLIAGLSLALWFSVIVFGRLIPYLA